MSLQDIQILSELACGSFGSVWLGNVGYSDKKSLIVIKKISLNSSSVTEKDKLKQEVEMLASIRHPNIVSYKGSLLQDGCICILMGYCERGDLYQVIKNQKGKLLPELKIIRWFIQISMAVMYLHQQNILHRDLKTRNIFLTKYELIKIGDFGISKRLVSSQEMAKTVVGTPLYMSPEILSGIPYRQEADIWSLGCCLYEMLTLQHAFQAKDLCSLIFKISNGKIRKIPKCYDMELANLVQSMLQNAPENRPSACNILRSNFIRKQMEDFLSDTIAVEKLEIEQKYFNGDKGNYLTDNVGNNVLSLHSVARRRRREKKGLGNEDHPTSSLSVYSSSNYSKVNLQDLMLTTTVPIGELNSSDYSSLYDANDEFVLDTYNDESFSKSLRDTLQSSCLYAEKPR